MKTIILVIILFVAFSACDLTLTVKPAEVLEWQRLADYPGEYASRGIAVRSEDKILVGWGDKKDLYEYDIKTNIWDTIIPFSITGRISPYSYTYNDYAYIMGGRVEDAYYWYEKPGAINSFNSLQYSNSTKQLKRLSDCDSYNSQLTNVCVIGSIAYLFGDYNSMPLKITKYDLVNDNFLSVGFLSEINKANEVSFSINNTIFLGKPSFLEKSYIQEFWAYNPIINELKRLRNYPGQENRGAVSFAIKNKGYVIGGTISTVVNEQQVLVASKDIWEYTPETDSWKVVGECPAELWYANVVVYKDEAYFFNSIFNNATFKEVWKFHPKKAE